LLQQQYQANFQPLPGGEVVSLPIDLKSQPIGQQIVKQVVASPMSSDLDDLNGGFHAPTILHHQLAYSQSNIPADFVESPPSISRDTLVNMSDS
jgi:hypothetical protein